MTAARRAEKAFQGDDGSGRRPCLLRWRRWYVYEVFAQIRAGLFLQTQLGVLWSGYEHSPWLRCLTTWFPVDDAVLGACGAVGAFLKDTDHGGGRFLSTP